MPYVQRDNNGKIRGITNGPVMVNGITVTEWVDDNNPDLLERLIELESINTPIQKRRKVSKSLIISRLTDQQLINAKLLFNQQPRLEARWNAPDQPAVYFDDTDTINFLIAIDADPEFVLAE